MGQLEVVFSVDRVVVVGRQLAAVEVVGRWCGGFSAWRVCLVVLMGMSARGASGCEWVEVHSSVNCRWTLVLETLGGRVRMQSAQQGSAGHFGTEEVWKAVGFPVCVWLVAAFPRFVRCQCRCHPIHFQGLLRLHTIVSHCSELPIRAAALLVFYFPMGM